LIAVTVFVDRLSVMVQECPRIETLALKAVAHLFMPRHVYRLHSVCLIWMPDSLRLQFRKK
jgi:hypothetical protein